MTDLLTNLLTAGLIDNLGGDDTRFEKMEQAAKMMAKELLAHPSMLIPAILAGLDPDVTADDPAIARAKQALVAKWKSMASVFTSPPVGLFRAILLAACEQAATEDSAAAILWLTAADTLPLMRLGKEESAVRELLARLAEQTETAALAIPPLPAGKRSAALKMEAPAAVTAPRPRKVDRKALLLQVACTAGPTGRGNQALGNPNPHWTNQIQSWSWEFSDRMRDVLADQLDALANDLGTHQTKIGEQLHASQAEVIKVARDALISQQRWVKDALQTSAARQQAEQLRLTALWWSEALYSPSLRRGYRELPAPLAAVVMAVDLLDSVTTPTPASVGYLLAEAVHRLPEAGFDHRRALPGLLTATRDSRGQLPGGWLDRLAPPPSEGRTSLRDLVILSLGNQEWNLDRAMARAGLTADIELSLPTLARALFRQEQATRLAQGVA